MWPRRVRVLILAAFVVSASHCADDDTATPRDGSGAGGTDAGGTEATGTAGDATQGGESGGPGLEPITIASGQQNPTGIAVDSNEVYWANRDGGTIVKCPVTGCGSGNPVVLADGIGAPLGIAVDASTLYWIGSAEETADGPIARVFKCPKAGCAGDPSVLFEFQVLNRPNDVHVIGDTLYYAAWPTLGTCPTAGCAETGPAPLLGGPFVAIDSDAEFLYFAKYGWGQLTRCPLNDCSSDETVLASEVRPLGLAVDATHVYFADHDYFGSFNEEQRFVSRCPIAGCGPDGAEIVASGDISPYAVAVDSRRFYFTNVEHGTVESVPK